jgi:hypothetical protein
MPRSSNTPKGISSSAKRRLDFDDGTKHDNSNNKTAEDDPVQHHLVPSVLSQSKTKITTNDRQQSTPRKNEKKRRVDSYFSPNSTLTSLTSSSSQATIPVVVTPEKVDAVASPATDYQQKKKQQKKKQIFHHDIQEETYVPIYIHKNLFYQRLGQASLSTTVQKTFQLVKEHYIIPKDIETNHNKYGPLSGTCLEERVIDAYQVGLLLPSKGLPHNNVGRVVEICTHCAVTGHQRDDCPELI